MIKERRIGVFLGNHISESDLLTLQGIVSYSRAKGFWQFTYRTFRDLPLLHERDLESWSGDGMIVLNGNHPFVLKQNDNGIPVVSLSHIPDTLPYHVRTDRQVCGILAAQHLMNQGYRSFALLFDTLNITSNLDTGFVNTLKDKGYDAEVARIPAHSNAGEKRKAWCTDWITGFKSPVGIMTRQEMVGIELISICKEIGMNVPNNTGIISMSGGSINSDSQLIALSRIRIELEQLGYEAARMLDQLLKGRKPASQEVWVSPKTVIVRESSNRLHPQDNIVNKALHFIQTNSDQRISVTDVVDHVHVSASTLKNRFRSQLNRSIHEEIRAAHIDRAKQLLLNSNLAISEVATACGFLQPIRLTEAFRRETGMTPIEFRHEHKTQEGNPSRRSDSD